MRAGADAQGNEHIDGCGYYEGAVYDSAIQMEINQAGNRMKGKWVGFGRDRGEMNSARGSSRS